MSKRNARAERVVAMSKVLRMCVAASVDQYAMSAKGELPRSEFSQLRSCWSAVNNSGGAPGGVAPTGVGVKITG